MAPRISIIPPYEVTYFLLACGAISYIFPHQQYYSKLSLSLFYTGALYGNGVYFANASAYSTRYCCPAEPGRDLKMYVVKVLVGKFTVGQEGMKAPPSRNDQNNPGKLYDSLVDKMKRPSIFVIFQDNQYYPEYLISFRKS